MRTYRGAARFLDGHTLEAGPDTVAAAATIIATGSQPRVSDAAPRRAGRITCDADTAALPGAEIAGTGASELIHLPGLAIGRADALSRIACAAYNHPTRSEEILNAVETLAAKWGLAPRIFL